MLVKFVRGNWKSFPEQVKGCLYDIAYLYSERAPFSLGCLDEMTNEVFSQVELESQWFQDNVEEALEDIEAGRVHKKPEGLTFSEWLSSLLDEE